MHVPEVVLVFVPKPPPPNVLVVWLFWPKPPPPNPKDMFEMVGGAVALPGTDGCDGWDDQGREERGSRAERVEVTKARHGWAQITVDDREIVVGREVWVGSRVFRAMATDARALCCSGAGGWGEVEVGKGGSFFSSVAGEHEESRCPVKKKRGAGCP